MYTEERTPAMAVWKPCQLLEELKAVVSAFK